MMETEPFKKVELEILLECFEKQRGKPTDTKITRRMRIYEVELHRKLVAKIEAMPDEEEG